MIVITTLAEYQTDFWVEVSKKIISSGQDVCVLSFDDRSSEQLEAAGVRSYNIPLLSKGLGSDYRSVFEKHSVSDINYWVSHERITFGISESYTLYSKLAGYLCAIDKIIYELKNEGHKLVFLQELGGFVSVVSSYLAARSNNIDNYFIEPSFFKGRLFFLKNSFSAPLVPLGCSGPGCDDVLTYIEDACRNQVIVIPDKDKHHYSSAFSKIFNRKNFLRLYQKLVDKYVHGLHQEFGFISRYVKIHFKMLINSVLLSRSYTDLECLEQFIYFPLHVPGDAALTLRSPEYLDQLALLEYLLRVAPEGYTVVVKEHPAQIGSSDVSRLKFLLSRYDNFKILPPSINNYAVISNADLVFSINSKSGAEAVMLGKNVVVVGAAFYSDSPLVHRVDNIRGASAAIKNALCSNGNSNEEIVEYFQSVWAVSYPGELYSLGRKDVDTFCESLFDFFSRENVQ